jgi:hypothetical protein
MCVSLIYFWCVIKTLLKYVLSCLVVLAITTAHAHADTEYKGITLESQVSVKVSNDADRFIQTFFSADTQSNETEFPINIIEKEVDDDDETKSQKYKLVKCFSDCSIFNYRDATIVLSEINNDLSPYSYFGESFECWYILYQVFQI